MVRLFLKYAFGLVFLLILPLSASAYGGGGSSSSSCAKPQFFKETPVKESTVPAFSEFSFVASANTLKDTIAVKVNGEPVDVSITEKRSGRFLIEGNLPQSVTQPGKVRVSVSAKSKDQCAKLFVYYVNVSP